VHHGIEVSMYYADPDVNQMECHVDGYATNEEANACMEPRTSVPIPSGSSTTPTSGWPECALER
jgi:hypothetical protein